MLAYILQLVIDGFAAGSVYAALGLAIVLVHRSTGLINFAQGAMAVFATYMAFTAVTAGVPLIGAIAIGAAAGFILGVVIERVLIRRFERRATNAAIVVTIGLFILIAGISGAIWSYNALPFPSLFPAQSIDLFGASVGLRSIGTIVVLLAVVLTLQLLFTRTRLGLAMRAVATNPDSSALSGIPVGRMLAIGWGLAGALGAIAGALVAPQLFLTPSMLDFVLVYALAACILGGLDSPVGVVIAAWLLGVVENLAGAFVPLVGDDLKIAVPFILMLLVLIVRPQGLLGRRQVVRV